MAEHSNDLWRDFPKTAISCSGFWLSLGLVETDASGFFETHRLGVLALDNLLETPDHAISLLLRKTRFI